MKIRQSINSPIRKNILANFYGIGIVLLNQIVLVPFYIVFWGNELYSDWIVISALTSIFCLSDAGLHSVIQNRFAIKMAEGDDRECKSLLASNYTVITIVAAVLIPIGLGYVPIFDITEKMNLRVVDRLEGSKIFMLLLVQVFITMYSTIVMFCRPSYFTKIFGSEYPSIRRKEYMKESIELKFEDGYFFVPKGYEGVLNDMYSFDYRQLPPEHLRGGHYMKFKYIQ